MRKGKKKKRILGRSRAERRMEATFLAESSLLEDLENMFVDYRTRRKVYVHPVPAPWSRVILLALVYALAISFAKFAWFQTVGKPQWIIPQSQAPHASLIHESNDQQTLVPSK